MNNHLYKFKITIGQQILLLAPMIVRYILLVSIYYYFFGFNLPTRLFYGLFIFVIITDIVPTLVVHIQYLFKNWNSVMVVDILNKIVFFTNKGEQKTIPFSHISCIKYYRSYGKGTGWYSFERYRYVKFILTDKSQIIITSVMGNKIEDKIEKLFGSEIVKEMRVLALIY